MFAAYSAKEDSETNRAEETQEKISWLENTSFQQVVQTARALTSNEIQPSQDVSTEQSFSDRLVLTPSVSVSIATEKGNAEIGKSKSSKIKNSSHSSRKEKKKKKKESDKKSCGTKPKSTKHSRTAESFSIPQPTEVLVTHSDHSQLKSNQSFYEDLKRDKDNFAFPYMYFKNVARYVGYHFQEPMRLFNN